MSSFLGGGGGGGTAPGSLLATSNLSWWVATTGSDSNPGTLAQPFATIQHAVNVAFQYNWQFLFVPSINVLPGTYSNAAATPIELPALVGVVSSQFAAIAPGIFGDFNTPSNVIINGPGGHDCFAFAGAGGCWWIDGFQIQNCGTAMDLESSGCVLFTDDIIFTGVTNSRITSQNTGTVVVGQINFTMTFTGGGRFLFRSQFSSTFVDFGINMVISNSQTYTTFVMDVNNASVINVPVSNVVNPGNVLGKRYRITAASQLLEDFFSDRSQYLGNAVGTIQANAGCIISGDPVINKITAPSGSVTLTPGTHLALLVPTTPLASLTVNLPTNMSNGEECEVDTTQNITAVTWGTTDGSTIVGAPGGLAASAGVTFVFDTADNAWYCLG